MIQLAVFDMAGTTVHDGDAVNGCFRAALAGAGIEAPAAAVNRVMGLPKPEAIRILLDEFAPQKRDTVNAIHDDFVVRMCQFYATDPAVRAMAGAAEVFATLRKAGVKLALNTGFSREIVDVILHRLGWQSAVDATIASDEVPRGRPFPNMIQHLMESFNVPDPRAVAKIGDTRVDLEEGAAAGCGLNIGVTSGSYTAEELRQYPHTHIVQSVADVPRIIAEYNGS